MGATKIGNIHLDKYSNELKQLIGKLHDDNLDAVHLKGGGVNRNEKVGIENLDQDLNDDNLIMDSDDEKKESGN